MNWILLSSSVFQNLSLQIISESPKTTLEEMKALKIPVPDRGYCVDELADYVKCYHKNSPFLSYHCSHQKHHLHECEYNRFVHVFTTLTLTSTFFLGVALKFCKM